MKESIIWVGMDVHARSVTIAEATDQGDPVVREVANDARRMKQLFTELAKRGQVRACYEAGPCGFELQRTLLAAGVSCDVIAPSLIPSRPGDRIKTDRRDAIRLLRLYRAGELTSVVVPSEEQEAARDLLRARDDLRRARTTARLQLSTFLARHGRHYRAGTHWTLKHWAWVRSQRFEIASLTSTFVHYVDQLDYFDQRTAELDGEIAKLAKDPLFEDGVARLTCLRGISVLSAMVLLTELGDLRRFPHPRQLMAYVGIVPGERSSGETRRRTGITKTGNAHVRRILVEAAWSYRSASTTLGPRAIARMRGQPPEFVAISRRATTRLARRHGRMTARSKNPQVIAVAIARELCAFVWALATTEVKSAA